MPILKENCPISDVQFGYRDKTSTILASSVLKETLAKFTSQNSNVYACFLDLSKAFERVDHVFLIDQLISHQVPKFLRNLLGFILSNSRVCVYFNGFFF